MTYEAIINDKDEESKGEEILTINSHLCEDTLVVLFAIAIIQFIILNCHSCEKICVEYQIDISNRLLVK